MNPWWRGLERSSDKLKPLYFHYHNAYVTTKVGSIVTNFETLLPMLLETLVTWSCGIMLQTKTIVSVLLRCLWPPTWERCDLSWGGTTDKVTWSFGNVLPRHYVTNLGRMVTNLKGLLPMLFDPLVRWSCEIIWQTKISNSSLHMATNKVCITIKLGMGVTCYEGIPPIMSHNPLITCSFEITWKVLAGWQLALRDSYSCYLTFWPRGFARSYDKQKSLYLCYHTAYGNQTWECCDL